MYILLLSKIARQRRSEGRLQTFPEDDYYNKILIEGQ